VTPAPRRTLVGTMSGLSARQRVYRTPDALEVDETEGYEVTRRRVFFDDVLLVTYHQFVGWTFVLAMSLLTAASAFVAGIVALSGEIRAAVAVFLVSGLPFALLGLLRLLLRVDGVTVYGKRTRAQVHFWFRKRRARQVFDMVCRLAGERQVRLAESRPAPEPPLPSSGGS
jgi:hypothetical protein